MAPWSSPLAGRLVRPFTVTDENGVDFPAAIFGPEPEVDGHVYAWIFPDRESGFGFDVGAVVGREVKRLGDGSGKYGA